VGERASERRADAGAAAFVFGVAEDCDGVARELEDRGEDVLRQDGQIKQTGNPQPSDAGVTL
jgi:hypothetical protein